MFGCECYVPVPEKERNKWQPKSTKCIFLGYNDENKAYKLYDQETKKIIVSCDVVFREQLHVVEAKGSPSTLSSSKEVIHYEPDQRAILTIKKEETIDDEDTITNLLLHHLKSHCYNG